MKDPTPRWQFTISQWDAGAFVVYLDDNRPRPSDVVELQESTRMDGRLAFLDSTRTGGRPYTWPTHAHAETAGRWLQAEAAYMLTSKERDDLRHVLDDVLDERGEG